MKEYNAADVTELKLLGRSVRRAGKPVPLFWTGSGIRVNVKCSEISVVLLAENHPYVRVEVDGIEVIRTALSDGETILLLGCGFDRESAHEITIFRETQAMSTQKGGRGVSLYVKSLLTDGEFLKVRERPLRLEFVGDSLTSGEGALGRAGEGWNIMWYSTAVNYACMTAGMLDADYSILSQGGWGTYCSFDNNINHVMPKYYEKVCGVQNDEESVEYGSQLDWNFGSYKPDAIIVNLGSNDYSFDFPAWTDPETNITYKQTRNPDGSPDDASIARFRGAVGDFVRKLRRLNPDSYILWAYGMLGAQLMPYISAEIDCYRSQTGDTRVSAYEIPKSPMDDAGACGHPGRNGHTDTAKRLTERLKQLLELQ